MPLKRALIVQHAEPETLAANFTNVLQAAGFKLDYCRVYRQAPAYDRFTAPELGLVDLLLILGGPYSANDPYPALAQEKDFILRALEAGKPVLGICLGAQLLAQVLGGRVEPTGGYQFGLRKLDLTPEGVADPVFGRICVPLVPTLHGECFSIPTGATKLAEGMMLRRDGTYARINMAFRYANSYGFQFEPQLTLAELEVWHRELREDYRLMGPAFDPDLEASRHLLEFARYAPIYEAQMAELLRAFLLQAELN